MLNYDTSWKVDVLWSEKQYLITNVPDDGNINLTVDNGVGIKDYFELTVPATKKRGNFVVYIYKADDEHKTPLWSWHFWVTDYKPEVRNLYPISKQYVYPVENGHVHRYEGDIWTAGNPCDNSFMMDRNLGDIQNFIRNHTDNSEGTLTYQFGRKDPFPSYITLYDIKGNTVEYSSYANIISSGNGIGVAYTVNHPLNFISGYLDFTSDKFNSWGIYGSNNSWIQCMWRDQYIPNPSSDYYPYYSLEDMTKKSIYDPCPPGWRIPPQAVWADFSSNTANNDNRGLSFYQTINGTSIQGVRYWPYNEVEGNYPVYGTIYYPYNNRRRYGYQDKSWTGLWPCYPSGSDGSSLSHLNIGSGTGFSDSEPGYGAYAIRCINQKKY